MKVKTIILLVEETEKNLCEQSIDLNLDLGHFRQKYAQATTSNFNSRRKNTKIDIAINLYLLNCDSFFSVRIELDMNFVPNILFQVPIKHIETRKNSIKVRSPLA